MDDSALSGVSFAENVKEGQKVEWEAEVSRHMPVRVSVNTDSLRRLNKGLADIDPELRKAVGKDIKSAVRPTASRILSRIPSDAPLSGMRGGGRLAWSKPRVGVYATPGAGRGSIARIEIFGSKPDRRGGFKMADRAGTRSNFSNVRRAHMRQTSRGMVQVRESRTSSGRILAQRLQQRYPLSAGGRGGRFAWQNFMKEKPFLVDQVLEIIDGFVTKVNRRGLK